MLKVTSQPLRTHAIAPFFAEAEAALVNPPVLPVVPSVPKVVPLVKKARKPEAIEEEARDKTPRRRSRRVGPSLSAAVLRWLGGGELAITMRDR
jgi:hypothetical protein